MFWRWDLFCSAECFWLTQVCKSIIVLSPEESKSLFRFDWFGLKGRIVHFIIRKDSNSLVGDFWNLFLLQKYIEVIEKIHFISSYQQVEIESIQRTFNYCKIIQRQPCPFYKSGQGCLVTDCSVYAPFQYKL